MKIGKVIYKILEGRWSLDFRPSGIFVNRADTPVFTAMPSGLMPRILFIWRLQTQGYLHSSVCVCVYEQPKIYGANKYCARTAGKRE
jgi:hypothetical protein